MNTQNPTEFAALIQEARAKAVMAPISDFKTFTDAEYKAKLNEAPTLPQEAK